MADTPTKFESTTEAGGSKDQHAMVLAFRSPIVGITNSARTDGALRPRLSGQTGLNDGALADSLSVFQMRHTL